MRAGIEAEVDSAELTTLESGLRVLTVPARTGSIAVLVFVGVGSRFETRQTSGVAHLLEHLIFSGTDARPSMHAIATAIDSLGCRFNAFTEREYTGYFVRGAAQYLEPAVEILTDVLGNARLDTTDIERERRVVLSEIRMHEDNPRALVRLAGDRALFGDTPLGWDVAGFRDVVESLTRAELQTFRALYQQERVILALTGEVEHAKALDLADSLHLPAGPGASPAPAQYAPGAHIALRRPIAQANLLLCLPAISYLESERRMMTARFLNSILGASMSSRLFRAVRERAGLCYSIRSFLEPYSDRGGLFVFANTPAARAGVAVRAIVGELERLAADGVTHAEIEKAAAMAKGVHVLEREDLGSLARVSAFELLQRSEISKRDARFALIESITADDVTELAAELLRRNRLRLALVGPPEAERAVREARILPDVPWLDTAELPWKST